MKCCIYAGSADIHARIITIAADDARADTKNGSHDATAHDTEADEPYPEIRLRLWLLSRKE